MARHHLSLYHRRTARLSAAVFFVFAFALAACAGGAGVHPARADGERQSVVLETSTGAHEFQVEIAATREQHARGLMFRRSLGPRQGMLFVYPAPTDVSMWMRNTYIPLDMIFIRADGGVHRIEKSAEPHSERIIESGDRVLAVLEVPGGTASRIGLRPGDTVRHPMFAPPGG